MKIAILSDIHGNWSALEIVAAHIERWRPDTVIVNGDVLNRGPRPAKCWRWVQQRLAQPAWSMTRGNHEGYVQEWEDPERTLTALEREAFANSYWTYEQLSRDLSGLRRLPADLTVAAPDRSRLFATHASRGDNTRGVLPWTTDDELDEIIGFPVAERPTVFVTSHTHRFFTRMLDDTLVVNTGSVGCPLDGDHRTGYAQLTWSRRGWQAALVRLEYDRAQTATDFEASGFLAATGPLGRLMFHEWREARSHMPHWGRRFGRLARAGEITLSESVQAYLETL